MKIFENLVTLRKKNNMTQKQLAEKLHLTPQAISKWEKNTSLPDVETLNKIALIFKVSLDELVGELNINKPVVEKIKPTEYLLKILYSSRGYVFQPKFKVFFNGKFLGLIKANTKRMIKLDRESGELTFTSMFLKKSILFKMENNEIKLEIGFDRIKGGLRIIPIKANEIVTIKNSVGDGFKTFFLKSLFALGVLLILFAIIGLIVLLAGG